MALLNSQYDAIMREYDEIRDRHRHELDARMEEVGQKIPGIRVLNDRVASLSVQAARMRVADPDAGLERFYEELDDIAKERIRLLTEAGYPADYLEMQYDCPVCHDTGYVDGKRCDCFRRAAARLLSSQYSVSGILEKENFSHFQFDVYSDRIKNEATGKTARETAEDAVRKAHAFVDGIGTQDDNLLIYGPTGVGKTFLSHCIAKEAIDRSFSSLYFTASDFFEIMAGAKFGHDAAQGSYEQMILDCDLLVIDDLGTELTNSFTASSLFRVVNERILKTRSTIISTNLMLDQLLETYTERTFSRITSHYTIIKLFGEDIRIQQKVNGGMR